MRCRVPAAPREAAVRRPRGLAVLLILLLAAPACSFQKFAIGKLGDALAESGSTYSSDNDPDLVAGALPFALKLIEGLLLQTPEHQGLLEAAASGFTQYAYAFVELPAREREETEYSAARAELRRARNLYLRARDYALRALDGRHAGMSDALRADPGEAVLRVTSEADVPLLYWTAASWGAAISLSKDDPELIADVPIVGSLLDRASEIQPDWDAGSLHEIRITYEASRLLPLRGAEKRARKHFQRAVELSDGQRAGPYVALAEGFVIKNQDRQEFETLLDQALAIDVDQRPEWRLVNLVMQRRARWLLSQADLLFLGPAQ